jgi:hypothetical protein
LFADVKTEKPAESKRAKWEKAAFTPLCRARPKKTPGVKTAAATVEADAPQSANITAADASEPRRLAA